LPPSSSVFADCARHVSPRSASGRAGPAASSAITELQKWSWNRSVLPCIHLRALRPGTADRPILSFVVQSLLAANANLFDRLSVAVAFSRFGSEYRAEGHYGSAGAIVATGARALYPRAPSPIVLSALLRGGIFAGALFAAIGRDPSAWRQCPCGLSTFALDSFPAVHSRIAASRPASLRWRGIAERTVSVSPDSPTSPPRQTHRATHRFVDRRFLLHSFRSPRFAPPALYTSSFASARPVKIHRRSVLRIRTAALLATLCLSGALRRASRRDQ